MKLLRSVLDAFASAFVDIARRPLFSLLSVAAMTVAIVIVAGFLLVSRGAKEIYGQLTSQAALEIYLKPGEPIEDLEKRLAGDPGVERVERVSPDQALSELARLYPDLGDLRQLLGENPLPASLRVHPRATDPAALAGLVETARRHPATLSVRYDREWLVALTRIGAALHLFGWTGSIVLLLAALVTVGAVVRLGLDDRLDEVRLLRLAGAPATYVLGPVLAGGALLGGAGAALALVLVAAARGSILAWAANGPLAALAQATFGPALPPATGVLLIAAGIVAGTASATVAAGRAALS